jgi:alpha-galactosidase
MRRRHFLESFLSAPALMTGLNLAGQTPRHKSVGWIVETKGISRRFEPGPAGGLRLKSLKNAETGHEWVAPGYADFAFSSSQWQFEGLSPLSGFRFAGEHRRTIEKGAKELRLDFNHQEHHLTLSLFYTAFPGTSVIEKWCRLENIGTKTIAGVSRFDPIFFALSGNAAEFQVRAVHLGQYAVESWPIDKDLEIRGGAEISGDAGFVAIENPSVREILFLGVKWERDWAVRFKEEVREVQVSAGLVNFSHDLMPGEVLETPRIFLGVAHGDLEAASRTMHDYLWKYVFPPALKDFPWVVYDIYTTEKGDVENTLMKEIDFSADLGIENFYYDASWYEGSSHRGTGDWGAGLGRYREDREKFPHGLDYLSSYAHSKGMKFGLWVDPAAIDQPLIPNEIPGRWVAQNDGKDIEVQVTYKGEHWAPLIKLCLGDPEVLEHIKSSLNRIVNQFHLDWLKWDNSGVSHIPCNRDDHGHQKGDGSYAAMRGEYAVWDWLHKNHPDLVLEQCATPEDFGKASSCRAIWLNDQTFPSRHVRDNVLSACYLFPSSYNGSYVLRESGAMGQKKDEVMQQKDPALLDTVFRSRMMGLFGFGSYEVLADRVSRFPQVVLDAARRNIAIYKSYRHLLAEDCHHLTPPFGSTDRWQVVEFCKRDGSEAVVLAFRNTSTQSLYRFWLKGLQSFGRYSVKSVNHSTETLRSAAELTKEGIIIGLPKGDMSEVLLLKRV